MKEVDPLWTAERVKPSKPFVHKSPVAIGQIAKLTLDILKEAREPMRSRDIAIRVLELGGVPDADLKTIAKTANSVNATLADKEARLVLHDGGWPRRWRIGV